MAEVKGRVAVLSGDGIGPEVMDATLKVAEATQNTAPISITHLLHRLYRILFPTLS